LAAGLTVAQLKKENQVVLFFIKTKVLSFRAGAENSGQTTA